MTCSFTLHTVFALLWHWLLSLLHNNVCTEPLFLQLKLKLWSYIVFDSFITNQSISNISSWRWLMEKTRNPKRANQSLCMEGARGQMQRMSNWFPVMSTNSSSTEILLWLREQSRLCLVDQVRKIMYLQKSGYWLIDVSLFYVISLYFWGPWRKAPMGDEVFLIKNVYYYVICW